MHHICKPNENNNTKKQRHARTARERHACHSYIILYTYPCKGDHNLPEQQRLCACLC